MESPLELSQIRGLIHAQDREAVEQYFENLGLLGGAQVSSVTLRVARPEGGWRWMEVRGRALSLGSDGKARTVLGVAVDITERRTMSLALDRAARAVLRAGELERRRVVRNLHDSLAQHLVGIDLGLSRLGRHVIPTADTSAITRDIRLALSAAHREVRTYSYLLHPPQLERQGLASALGALLDGFGRRADLTVRMEVSGQPQPVGAEVELALFRVAQEAIMNIHRHAHASRVTLRLERSQGRLTLEVEDDGVGMPEDPDLTTPRQDGVGIPGMMARLAQMGGSLELRRPTKGVCLRASVPI
jgi:signal transduction histidine kinase